MCARLLALAIAALTLLAACSTAGATTISATPATLGSAIGSAQGGDTVELQSGSYGSLIVSGQSRASTVTVRPAAGAQVTVADIDVKNSSRWDIVGVNAPGGSLGVSGSSNVMIRDVAFGATSGDGGGVIYIVASSNVLLKGVSAGPIKGADAVMIWPGAATNTNITLDGVYIHDLDSDPNVDHQDCVQAASFDGLTIRNSRFINCYAQGVFVNPFGGATARNVTIENNFITYWTPPGRPGGGNALNIGDLTGGTLLIRNNTINANPTIGVDERAATSSAQVISNIFYGVSAFACGVYAGRVDVFDHNVTSAACSGATSNTVASSATLESQFVSASDLHLKAGAVAVGKAGGGVAVSDIDGETRDAAPDAGADELVGSPPPPSDTTAPDTTITTGPADSQSTDATVAFTASEAGSTFECKLDAAAFVSCTSPRQYTGLAVGQHTIQVRATDIAGNTDATPASVSWQVQAPPPPPDPCAQTRTERDQALADLAAMTSDRDSQRSRANAAEADLADAQAALDATQANLADMTASRDSWRARAEKAEDQVQRVKAITLEP